MLWCPNSNGICLELITPLPRTALYITDVPKTPNLERTTIEKAIRSTLKKYAIQVIFAPDFKKGSNVLCKICKLVQQVPMGYLLYDSKAKRRAVPNLFYEISLMHYLGKDTIMIGFKEKRPSDLESIEWIHYKSSKQTIADFNKRVKTILNTDVYASFSDVEIKAGNYLVAIEYLKKILLINPDKKTLGKLLMVS
jgi:tetratricopeptide (TPR) repeat protein